MQKSSAAKTGALIELLASRSWLARSDLGYLVLGREPGMALLNDRRLWFPAVELLELQGLTDGIIYDGTTKGERGFHAAPGRAAAPPAA